MFIYLHIGPILPDCFYIYSFFTSRF